MATYKEIKGVTVQTKDTDPVVNTGPGGAWASAPSLNTARWITTGCAYGYTGSATLALCVGGRKPPGATYSTNNEQFDGASWTELADINSARDQLGGNGTTTSGLVAGGYDGAVRAYSESWNGSSWTETNDLNTARYELGSAGATNTAAIRFSGAPSKSETETWNGSSWTEVADVNTTMTAPAGAGTSTAALKISGENPSAPTNVNVEQWNGSAWTEIANVNTSRRYGVGAGDVNTALFYGGNGPPEIAKTESWDGSSWTEVSDLGTAIAYSGGGGNSGNTAAINYGGQDPSVVGTTETFSVTPVTAETLVEGMVFLSGGTTLKGFGKAGNAANGSWASGENVNTARDNPEKGFGVLTAGVLAGGPSSVVEEYNGTSWTEVNAMPATGAGGAGCGTESAGIIANWKPSTSAETLLYDGTSWTETGDLNDGRDQGGCFGTQTSAVFAAGYKPSPGLPGTNSAEVWDGSSWTEVAELNDARWKVSPAGISSTSGLIAGGYDNPPTNVANTEEWNGTSWTEKNNMNTGRNGGSGGGGTDSMIFAGGGPVSPGPQTTKTEIWNGTSWTEVGDLTTKRENMGYASQAGAQVGQYAASGNSAGTSVTEEWLVDAALSTVTVS